MGQSKEPIRLRRRVTPSGHESLYLDIYLDGRRSYEYLKLYLVPERTRADKEANRQTLQLAEAVRAKRLVELRNGQFGFQRQAAADIRFFDYYRMLCERRISTESRDNWGNWRSCLHHLKKYERRESITFADITPAWIKGFKDYLENDAKAWEHDVRERRKDAPLSRNSKMCYFNKLRACINSAYNEGIISVNPLRGIAGFKAEDATRMYLTVDEVRQLAATECKLPAVKAAFLFSCLTGLRRSDIERLTWSQVHRQGDFTRIIFQQKKTGGLEYLDITAQARNLMGTEGAPGDPVFPDIHTPFYTNSVIKEWVARAGINKTITFHCARHTFATMMLDLGTDLYTVSKLLGHRKLTTTQIYARVLDKNKQAAVAAIPDIMPTD